MLLRKSPDRLRIFRSFTSLGVVCIGLAVLLGRISTILPHTHFFEGLCIGLGVTMATAGFVSDLRLVAIERKGGRDDQE